MHYWIVIPTIRFLKRRVNLCGSSSLISEHTNHSHADGQLQVVYLLLPVQLHRGKCPGPRTPSPATAYVASCRFAYPYGCSELRPCQRSASGKLHLQ